MCIKRTCGFSLIEQLMVIVIVAVGIVGVLSTMNVSIARSSDPLVRKQMIAVAEALLSEVIHQPMTWCDPDDAKASTSTGPGDCASAGNNQDSPTLGESRNGGVGTQFDNVMDYSNYGQSNATDAAGNNVLNGYQTLVTVTPVGSAWSATVNGDVLQVTVTVSYGSDNVSLTGYRFRYAPRF